MSELLTIQSPTQDLLDLYYNKCLETNVHYLWLVPALDVTKNIFYRWTHEDTKMARAYGVHLWVATRAMSELVAEGTLPITNPSQEIKNRVQALLLARYYEILEKSL